MSKLFDSIYRISEKVYQHRLENEGSSLSYYLDNVSEVQLPKNGSQTSGQSILHQGSLESQFRSSI
jgi:hypothetical protein